MAKEKIPVPILIDHREIGVALDLGGTSRTYWREKLPGNNWRISVADDNARVAVLETGVGEESFLTYRLFPHAVSYNRAGEMLLLTVDVAGLWQNGMKEVSGSFQPGVVAALNHMCKNKVKMVLEVDLRGGLSEGDRNGWLQTLCLTGGKKVDNTLDGREIIDGNTGDLVRMTIIGEDGEPVGSFYLKSESKDGVLAVGVGDEKCLWETRWRRKIFPVDIGQLKTPESVLQYLMGFVFRG